MTTLALPVDWQTLLTRGGHDPAVILQRLNAVLPADTVPARPHLLRAFTSCPVDHLRVVILGQDPYPTPGHACGLAFAVPPGTKPLPRSLQNIRHEVQRSTGAVATEDLADWARQGVLLLNRWLSLDEDPAVRLAWDWLTSTSLAALIYQAPQPLAILGWGNPAMRHLEDNTRILHPSACAGPRLYCKASHPSPLSARRSSAAAPAFLGCGHFATVNGWLSEHHHAPLSW